MYWRTAALVCLQAGKRRFLSQTYQRADPRRFPDVHRTSDWSPYTQPQPMSRRQIDFSGSTGTAEPSWGLVRLHVVVIAGEQFQQARVDEQHLASDFAVLKHFDLNEVPQIT